MSEFSLIGRFVDALGGPEQAAAGMRLGTGDDAACFSGGPWPLVTVDTMVEGVHWDARFSSWVDVGYKALACNFSDIAAMGGSPGPFLVAISLPSPIETTSADALAEGMLAARRDHEVDTDVVVPVGGDVTRSPGPAVVTIVQFGRPGRNLLSRQGARPGDDLWVSGTLGCSAAGLAILSAGRDEPEWVALTTRHRRPLARLAVGRALAELDGVRAGIDLSDGLAGDLDHLLEASGVGARVVVPRLPVSPDAHKAARALDQDANTWALSGGEDYELLVSATPATRPALAALGMSRIGLVVDQTGLVYTDSHGHPLNLDVTGYRHR